MAVSLVEATGFQACPGDTFMFPNERGDVDNAGVEDGSAGNVNITDVGVSAFMLADGPLMVQVVCDSRPIPVQEDRSGAGQNPSGGKGVGRPRTSRGRLRGRPKRYGREVLGRPKLYVSEVIVRLQLSGRKVAASQNPSGGKVVGRPGTSGRRLTGRLKRYGREVPARPKLYASEVTGRLKLSGRKVAGSLKPLVRMGSQFSEASFSPWVGLHSKHSEVSSFPDVGLVCASADPSGGKGYGSLGLQERECSGRAPRVWAVP